MHEKHENYKKLDSENRLFVNPENAYESRQWSYARDYKLLC